MAYSIDDWDRNLPRPIRHSTFAAFVRKIGSQNSSYIRHIKFSSSGTEQASSEVFLATTICEYHLKGLESFRIYVVVEIDDFGLADWDWNWGNPPYLLKGYALSKLTICLFADLKNGYHLILRTRRRVRYMSEHKDADLGQFDRPFDPMFRALNAFVNKLHWLKEFKYEGETDFEEDNALAQLRELEMFVAERAKLGKVGEQRRLEKDDVQLEKGVRWDG